MQINKKRLKKVIYSGILLFALFIGYYLANKFLGFGIECPINHYTGYLCPGCGITRCLFSILELHFEQAFHYNSLVFVLLPFFAIYCGYNIFDYIFERNKPIVLPNYLVNFLIVIVIMFGIIRNIL